MQLRNVDAVTPLRAAVEEAEANPDLGIAVDSGSSTIDDFNIGSRYLLSSQSTLMSGEGWFDGSVATFSGTKDNPGLGEIYHFTIEPGETKTFLLGFWLPVDADLGDLWLMAAAGGQRPNGNFFKLDVTAASPQAAAGTSLEA